MGINLYQYRKLRVELYWNIRSVKKPISNIITIHEATETTVEEFCDVESLKITGSSERFLK